MWTTQFLVVSAVVELGAGLVFLAAPGVPMALLVGPAPVPSAAIVIGRLTGAALLSLGAACWWARHDTGSAASNGLVRAMLIYNAAAAVLLASLGVRSVTSGLFLWGAAALHGAMTIWCVSLLRYAGAPATRGG